MQEIFVALEANLPKYEIHKVFKKRLKSKTFDSTAQKFIESCALMSWKMVTQTPPLLFKLFKTGPGNPFDDRVQEAAEESPDPTQHAFDYYVFPVLMETSQPNKLLVKGKIMCKETK